MKKQLFCIMFIVLLAITLLSGTSFASIYHNNTNGATCVAANQSQAFGLAWNHARISNTSTQDRWILCPVQRSMDYTDHANFLNYYYDAGIEMFVWFGPDAAAGAEVTCIARQADRDMATNVAAAAITRKTTASGALPIVETLELSFATFGTSNSTPITVACQLPPGTGINTIQTVVGIQDAP